MQDKINLIEQREPKVNGRRQSDQNKCAMHDFLHEKNDNCLDIIKQSIKDEVRKTDHKFEVLENRMEKYISKWALGMIVLVSSSMVGGLLVLGMWHVDSLGVGISGLTTTIVKQTEAISVIGVKLDHVTAKQNDVIIKQTGVLDELKTLEPEHLELMRHMKKSNQD